MSKGLHLYRQIATHFQSELFSASSPLRGEGRSLHCTQQDIEGEGVDISIVEDVTLDKLSPCLAILKPDSTRESRISQVSRPPLPEILRPS